MSLPPNPAALLAALLCGPLDIDAAVPLLIRHNGNARRAARTSLRLLTDLGLARQNGDEWTVL